MRTYTPVTARVPPPPIDTSSLTRTGPLPLERVPTEPASAPPRPEQPTRAELALLGIKVCDFAFERNTLPPVPSVKRPYFREFGTQQQGSQEDTEARRRNEVRRLEFNTPRKRAETTDEREALRLAFNSPRMNGIPSGGLRSSSRYDGASRNNFDLSIFSKWNSILNSGEGPSYASSPRPRLPLQRQPSEIYVTRLTAGASAQNSSTGLFSNQHLRHGSALFASHTSNTSAAQAHDSFVSSQLPGLNRGWLAASPRGSQSQPLASTSPPDPIIYSSQNSQTDSEMDDEEYVKTPIVTPNGSLLFDDDAPSMLSLATGTNADRINSIAEFSYARTTSSTNSVETNDSVIDSSTLPESQMAGLLLDTSGPDENVSASQIGLESQDLLSQPAWQQLSQSQAPTWSQQAESQAGGDVEMPTSQPEDVGSRNTECDLTPTSTPTPSFTRTNSILVSPVRACTTANSNHSATTPQPRPIPRISPRSSPSRRSPNPRLSTPADPQLSLRRSPSFNKSGSLNRRPSLTGNMKPSLSAVPASVLSVGKARYNLRSPSPKKAKVLGLPSLTSPSVSRPRSRSRTQSVPASKRGSTSAVNAAVARRTRSAAAQARSRAKTARNGGEDGDVVMAEEANDNQVPS